MYTCIYILITYIYIVLIYKHEKCVAEDTKILLHTMCTCTLHTLSLLSLSLSQNTPLFSYLHSSHTWRDHETPDQTNLPMPRPTTHDYRVSQPNLNDRER